MRTLRRVVLVSAVIAAGLWIHDGGLDSVPGLGRFFCVTPHERYAAHLRGAAVANSQQWLDAANTVLEDPRKLTLPSSLKVSFDHGMLAVGYTVSLRRGQRYVVEAATERPFEVFIDVFRKLDDQLQQVASAARGVSAVALEVRSDGDYIVRVQPTLDPAANVALTVYSEPTLALPVLGARPDSIQSFFGAVRDGGRRSHHGLDIFAKRGTPVTAAADGFVTSVGTNGLGGNVIWIARIGHGERHYYAHLDQQLVSVGRWVRRGDVIGTVGNTGNARTTEPHLHFGIYGNAGPLDPLPYVRRTDARAERNGRGIKLKTT